MAILEDIALLGKKIFVTILIYIIPITILVGGLLLIEHVLSDTEIPSSIPIESISNQNH